MNSDERRTHEQMTEPAGERDPQLRMLQVDVEVDEKYEDEVGLGQAVLMRGLAENVIASAVRQPGEHREDVEEDAHIDRVDAEVRQRREHRRRMMNLWNSQRSGTRCDR